MPRTIDIAYQFTKQQIEYANKNNRDLIAQAFEILIKLDCEWANCNICIFKDDRIESKCHLTYPMNKFHRC
jgi:hypothetical protein